MAEIKVGLVLDAKGGVVGVQHFQKSSKSAFDKIGKSGTSAFAKIRKKGKSAFDALKKAGKSAATTFSAVWRKAVLGFTVIFGAATLAVLKFVGASRELNKEMANVATLIPGAVSRVVELKREVQLLAIDTGKSTTDLAQGLFQVISAFGDSADSVTKLRITAQAATAGMATTTQSLNLLSAVTKGYGDTSLEATAKAADLAFMTNKLGQTTFPELAASIGRVVPLAAKLGVSQEELFAGFATLTGVTGNAAEVSTQLAGIQRAMIKPTEDMANAIKNAGFSSAGALIEAKGLGGALKILIAQTDGSTEAVTKLFGRAEPLVAVFALTGAQAGDFATKLDAMKNSAGAMLEAYKASTEGIASFDFKVRQAKQGAAFLSQTLGELITQNTFFSELMNKVKNVFVDSAIAVERNKDAYMKLAKDGIVAIVKGIGAALKVMQFFHNAWNGLKVIGNAAVVVLVEELNILFKGLKLILRPLDLMFQGLIILRKIEINPFDKAEEAIGNFRVSSKDVLKEVIDDIVKTNSKYEAVNKTVASIVVGLQNMQAGQKAVAEGAPPKAPPPLDTGGPPPELSPTAAPSLAEQLGLPSALEKAEQEVSRTFEGPGPEKSALEKLKAQQDAEFEILAQQQLKVLELAAAKGEKEGQLEVRLTEFKQQQLTKRAQFETDTQAKLRSMTQNSLMGLLQFAAQHNKKAFAILKAINLAKAVVSVGTGVAKALELPYPYNLVAAANVALQGAQVIASIKSAQPGGGGSRPSISSGGGGGSGSTVFTGGRATATTPQIEEQTGFTQNVTIKIITPTGTIPPETIDMIMDGIEDARPRNRSIRNVTVEANG